MLGLWGPILADVLDAWANGQHPAGNLFSLSELLAQVIVVALMNAEENAISLTRVERTLSQDSDSISWISELVHKHWKGFKVRARRIL